jgi:hypothetical protein
MEAINKSTEEVIKEAEQFIAECERFLAEPSKSSKEIIMQEIQNLSKEEIKEIKKYLDKKSKDK